MNRISVNVLFALVFLSLLSPFIYTVEAAVVCTGTTKCTHLKLHNGSGLCDDTETAWCVCAAGHANHVTTGECVEGAACTGGAGSCAGTGHTGTCAANGTDCICKLGYTDGGAAAGTCGVDTCTASPAPACGTHGPCAAFEGCNCNPGYANIADGTCVDICTVGVAPICPNDASTTNTTCTPNHGCNCTAATHTNIADGTCVKGAACTPGSCTGTGHTGTCTTAGGDCLCKVGYTDGGAAAGTCAVDVCTTFVPAAACSTNGDGTCTANMGCNCDLGYANVADGTCEDICTAAPPVCSSTNDDGTCTANTGCKCNPGYANIADGRCVDICTVGVAPICPNDASTTNTTCTPNHGCNCTAATHTNIADGTCMEGVVCSLKTRCNEENHNGSGLCITSNDEWCRCAEGFENDIFGQCIYSADGYEKAGSAVKPEDCKFSFLLALAIVVMAYVQWV
eukprot:Lankesteria_metandrocarpae@DN5434_c0_g1_i18.p1